MFSPFVFSTLLALFCSFVISYSLSCVPFFSLVFILSVKTSSFSISSSTTRFSLLVLLLMFSVFCIFPHFFAILPLIFMLFNLFSQNSGFQKHTHTHTTWTRTLTWEISVTPLKPLFLLWFQDTRPKRPKFQKHPFTGCTRNGAFFGPPSGRPARFKSRKTSNSLHFKGTTIFKHNNICHEKIDPPKGPKIDKKCFEQKK